MTHIMRELREKDAISESATEVVLDVTLYGERKEISFDIVQHPGEHLPRAYAQAGSEVFYRYETSKKWRTSTMEARKLITGQWVVSLEVPIGTFRLMFFEAGLEEFKQEEERKALIRRVERYERAQRYKSNWQ